MIDQFSLDLSAKVELNGEGFPYVVVDKFEVCIIKRITKFEGLDENNREMSDEQLVISLYQSYGKNFVERLDGDFVILIKDKEKKKLSIFNNPYTALNLYYYFDRAQFLFADGLNDLLKNLPVKREVNKSVLKSFLANGWNQGDQTMVKGVFKILPSFVIEVDNQVNISNYWDSQFSFNRRPFNNLEDHMDHYEKIYQDGIKRFVEKNKTQELGTLLSGGHDTSFALIQGTKVHDRPMHSFTATFPGWAFDEGDYAENLSKKFGSIHHPIPFKPEDLDFMPSLIIANEEPVVGSSLPVHLCAKEAENHVDTMLAGDGGDTLWGEYFPVGEIHRYVKDLPVSFRKGIYSLSKTLRKTFDWERLWELEHVTELFAHEDMYGSFLRRLCTYRHFTDSYLKKLLNDSEFKNIDYASPSLELEFNRENFSEMLIEGKLFNGFYTYQSFHTYRSMNHFGLELYLPTINRELMRFITELPKNWVNGGTTFHRLTNAHSVNRRFHKKVLSRYLEKDEIYNRSFDIPWYNILRPRPQLLEKLKVRLKNRGWFDNKVLDQMFDEFMDQKVKDYELLELKHHGYRIFTLLSLEVWCIEFIDGKGFGGYDKGKVSLEDYLS